VYRANPNETLQDVVSRAGGLTSHSYLYASQLTRVSTQVAEEEELKISIAQMQKDLTSRYASTNPTLNSTTATDQRAELGLQQALIAQVSAVHPTGRIVLGMKPDGNSVGDIPPIPLEDGDSFYIPPMLTTIQVMGAVYNANAFRYQQKEQLSKYLDDAGGPTRQADVKHIYLIRADGTVINRQSHSQLWHGKFEKILLLPGDAIVVPTKIRTPGGFMQELPFITQIISQTAMTGAVLGVVH
jgi:protein involved in polysaccharide export with SLBB domain